MRSLFFWLVLGLVGCVNTNNYYPGTVPKSCKVSDGYCYHYSIVDNDKGEKVGVVDVYLWTPRDGWKFHHREPRS